MTVPFPTARSVLTEAGYVEHADHRVWARRLSDEAPFRYSDGDEVEERIAAAIASSRDRSIHSSELRTHQVDWPSIYHLSATRANLLRPLHSLFANARVLEIGAGCGAISRYLGEAGAELVAIEGSARRASIAAARCEDLANVAVVNERFEAFAPSARFDVVTLIGVLEYSRIYTSGSDPIHETLRRARELLTDDGVLVVAIENQLGLKYFAGMPEDHLGRAMAGIQDEYGEHTVVTFGKGELERRLRQAGFEQVEFALPFPDYKLPQNVVLPAGLTRSEFDAATLGAQATRADRQLRSGTLFSLTRTFDVLGRNGLLADLSNSFLVVAGKSAAAPSFETVAKDVLAEQYSVERDTAFIKGAAFIGSEHGIHVDRFRIGPDTPNASKLFDHVVTSEPYVSGRRWADTLDRILNREGWTIHEVSAWFDKWLATLAAQAELTSPIGTETPVPGTWLDATPGNLIVSGNDARFFDLEWRLRTPTTLGFLSFRALKLTLGQFTAVAMPADANLLHTDTLIRVVLRRAGLIVTPMHIQQYLGIESAFITDVQGTLDVNLSFESYLTETLGVLPNVDLLLNQHATHAAQAVREAAAKAYDIRGAQAEIDRLVEQAAEAEAELRDVRQQLEMSNSQLGELLAATSGDQESSAQSATRFMESLREENRSLGMELARQQAELALVTRSRSWRITAPLRHASGLARRVQRTLRPRVASGVKRLYRAAPLSARHKRVLKGYVFRAAAPLLRHTNAYRRWDAEYKANRPVVPSRTSQSATTTTVVDTSVGNVLWQADGTREWEAYDEVKSRVEGKLEEIRQTRRPARVARLDFSKADAFKTAAEIGLPRVDAPRVTILVPVFNHLSTTLECLASIARSARPGDPSFEVLVANDASTDESAAVLATVPNLRLVNQPKNLGFLLNCNTAARDARGDFLILLNNDVQVTPGWLQALVSCIESDERIGAVGPRIVYPNGWLQEAGTRLLRDGSSEMLGLNDQPDLARYSYTRDVDYCSGACLLIRRSDFARLGGFDEGFAPAYCEDSDLCMRLRAEGKRIVYCADAEVVHQLSTTSDAMPSDYKLSCIARNLDRFGSKWREDLDRMNEVRTIAFYLPQFHPIPENDVWWGQGFTEWTNVSKARPNYVGHYQPRMPADLGYYDLRLSEVMEKQAELARRYGIGGFCFYYYWFAGHRLLERPLEQMLETGRPDFPFCLCWANENWTRRWDGQENEVLMAQKHSDDDDLAVIQDLARYFRSPNYIRVDGKPLILVYRITLFPDFARTARIWREECHRLGIGDIYIAQVESFELAASGKNPSDMGCDAAVEFPPQGMATPVDLGAPLLNPNFQGTVADYRDIAVRYSTRELPPYKRFMGVMPGWDNTARRQDNSYSFMEATPGAFQAWMEATVRRTKQQFSGDERLIFINAWNEWAEGAYLEPDRRFGHTFLEAHRNALDADYLSRHDKYSLG